uniref:hypothetical protein n=1 Tax=Pappia fissilis TaxID=1040649 RepID=UPI002A7ED87C|nr:hypothetical protein UYP79_mgp002 [Pappia fissilis]WOX61244.1 hypothetical protein [Pappia fissilis]
MDTLSIHIYSILSKKGLQYVFLTISLQIYTYIFTLSRLNLIDYGCYLLYNCLMVITKKKKIGGNVPSFYDLCFIKDFNDPILKSILMNFYFKHLILYTILSLITALLMYNYFSIII